MYGALVLHDSRVSEKDNSFFFDLLEDYFNRPLDELQKDERPELGYQVGVTYELTERPKCAVDEPCLKIIEALKLRKDLWTSVYIHPSKVQVFLEHERETFMRNPVSSSKFV